MPTKKSTKKKATTITIDAGKECCSKTWSSCSCSKSSGCSYGLGVLGAAIYFISTATSFWGGVFGLLKALVWPAIVVFEVLKFLGV